LGSTLSWFGLACSKKYESDKDYEEYNKNIRLPQVDMISALFWILAIVFTAAGIALLI
jgi:hypothetical protein